MGCHVQLRILLRRIATSSQCCNVPLLSQPRLSHNMEFLTMRFRMDIEDEDFDGVPNRGDDDDICDGVVGQFFNNATYPRAEERLANVQRNDPPAPRRPTGRSPVHVNAHLRKALIDDSDRVSLPRFTPELVEKRDHIRLMAEKILGSRPAAQRWFCTVSVHILSGKTPLDLMTTVAGCAKVEQFLLSLYPSDQLGDK